MRFPKYLLTGLTLMMAMVALPQMVSAQRIIVRPYGYYGVGWPVYPAYYPAYYSAYYPSYYPQRVVVPQRSGEVKIETHLKIASFYVDGGFVGRTGKLKISLQPGNHEVEVRDGAGRMLFHDRVNVLAGRTVEIKL